MIKFTDFSKIYIAADPVDCRYGVDRFASIIMASFEQDPFDGSLYIFTNKRRNLLKCIFWDGVSFWLLTRKLEKGCFKWTKTSDSCALIDHDQLDLLLRGMMFEAPECFTPTHPGPMGPAAPGPMV